MKTSSNGLTGVFHQIHKEEIEHKLLHKTQEEEGTVCNLNNEALPWCQSHTKTSDENNTPMSLINKDTKMLSKYQQTESSNI